MTNEERDLITRFIERVGGAQPSGSVPGSGQALPPVDHDADALIGDLFNRNPDARYRLTGDDGKVYGEWTGAALMEAGFRSPRQHDAYPHGCADYAAFQIELTRVEG